MNRKLATFLMALLFAGINMPATAGVIKFEANNLAALGADILLEVDFIDGDGTSNTAHVFGITTDGVAAPPILIGSTSAVPGGFFLEDASFFSSLGLQYSNATMLSFSIDVTNNSPAPGAFADTIAISILDPNTNLPLLFTDEPLGTNALVSWIASGVGNGSLQVYKSTDQTQFTWISSIASVPNNSVPEPNSGLLSLFGLISASLFKVRYRENKA